MVHCVYKAYVFVAVVEHALVNTTLEVIVYQGQLDIICDVVGMSLTSLFFTICVLPVRKSNIIFIPLYSVCSPSHYIHTFRC